MKINIGSKNDSKISALREILQEYDFLKNAAIVPVSVPSGVADQPKSMEETIRGAINRARSAFKDCNLSVGLESGLFAAPYTKSGYMDTCCCAIFDGKQVHLGLSSSFEYPKSAIKLVFDENADITQAFNKIGLTKDETLGSKEGAIGILTKGRLTRKGYTKEAIRAALIHLENPDIY